MNASPDRGEPDGPDDAGVITRVLKGDKQAFEHLVSRYQHLLYRHAVAMVLDHDAAADMVQDAFVRAYVNLRDCRDHSRFRAWLFRTLRNRCLDHLKEAGRRNVRLDDVFEPQINEADTPGALVERNELRAGITRALAQLPSTLGTSRPVSSTSRLSMPIPAQADRQCSTVSMAAVPFLKAVRRARLVTFSTRAAMRTG